MAESKRALFCSFGLTKTFGILLGFHLPFGSIHATVVAQFQLQYKDEVGG